VLASLFNPQGYLSILVLMILTGCGLPVPEEVFIISAGVLSAVGRLDPTWAFAATLTGALVGDAVMYAIGYRFGHSLLARHPRFGKIVGAQREAEYEEAIQRHGFKVLLLSRFMVGVRGPVYLAAGILRMPFARFFAWDLVCATLVVSVFFGLSYRFGRPIAEFVSDAEWTFTLIVLAIVLTVALFALRRHRRHLMQRALDEE
jgi:membrane protein DedA with SNARE-associated domain